MPDLEGVSYSKRRALPRSIYLHKSEIICPPEGGWPSITQAYPEVLARFGKSDKVISLLAHLPYIRNKGGAEDGINAIADCPFAIGTTSFLAYLPNRT
ncbi:hypothetical protein PG988_013356 [Apiospora saccharicola]